MRVSTMLDSIFGVPKKLSIIFRGQQKNSGMDPPVLKVREYPPWACSTVQECTGKRVSSGVDSNYLEPRKATRTLLTV